MDFHGLTRKELQTICKKNKIPANMTNIAMADALAALQYVEGLDDLMNQSYQSQEKVAPETPLIVNRAKLTNEDTETARTCRTTRRTMDQQNKNVAETPAGSTSRRKKTQVASSSVHTRTRQSVRLLEKTMSKFSLKDTTRAEPVVEMDFLDQTHVSAADNEEEWEDIVQQKNVSDDDNKANTDETEPVDVEADERATESIAADDDDSDSQKPGAIQHDNLMDKTDSNQVASKESAGNNSDSQKSGAIQQGNLIDEVDSNQVASKEFASNNSDSQKSVANQQDNLIAEADLNQFATKPIAAEASGSQKSVAACVEQKLVDVSLIEAYADEIPNSNSVKQISPSSLENAMKNLVNVYVMPAEEFGMAIAKQTNECDSGPRPIQSEENKENIDSSEMKGEPKVKKNNNIVDHDNELKSLNDMSLRQLNKMLKEKLQISNKNKNEEQNINITKTQVGTKPRPALQTLPQNQKLAGEPNNEN